MVAISSDGNNVYVAWEDNTGGKYGTYVTYSSNGGNTFHSPPINFGMKGNAHQVHIFADGPSSVYLVWNQPVGGAKQVFFEASHDGGVNWLANPINLSNAPTDAISAVVAATGNNVYVAWNQNTTTANNIFLTESHNGGSSFDPPFNISYPFSSNSLEPEIAVSGSNVYVVYTGINVRVSHNDGSTWNDPIRVSLACCSKGINGGSPGNREPKVAAAGSNLYVVWPYNVNGRTRGNYEAQIAVSHDSGDTWFPTYNMSKNSGPSREVEVEAVGSNVYTTWRDSSSPGSGVEPYFRVGHVNALANGTTFDPIINLAPTSSFSEFGYGQIAAYGTNVNVIWADSSVGNNDIIFRASQDSGATFAPFQNLSNNAGNSQALADPGDEGPIIAAFGTHVFVVWQDDTSGNNEVLFRAS